MTVLLSPNDRYAVVGKSGSGKTVAALILACELIPAEIEQANGWECWYIDTKADRDDIRRCHQWGFVDWDPFTTTKPNLLSKRKPLPPRRLIRIPFDENNPEETQTKVQDLCNRAMRQTGVLIVIDEYAHVCPSTRDAGRGLKHVFQRGRGRMVGIIGCTQEPVDVPRQLLSQASHIFLFYLTYTADQKRAREIYRFYDPETIVNHGFYYSWIDSPEGTAWKKYANIGEWDSNLR